MLKKFVLAIALGSALGAAPVMADPIKIESENIILYGDAIPKRAKQMVEKMELYRRLIMTLSNVDPRPDDQKLTIYAFDSVSDLGKFIGRRNVAGLYTNGYDGPLMLTPLRGAENQDSFNNQVALHEYSHHILHGYLETAYPRWYDEGFANYLSTFKVDDGTIQLGRAAAKHAEGLFPGGPKWVDVEDVVGAIRVYPFSEKSRSKRRTLLSQFYAQSWLYVHYLHSNKALSKRLGDYLNRVNSGEEPLSAFENGFGVSPKEFHKAAQEYWFDNKFVVQQFKPKPEFMKIEMKAYRLSKDELNMQMALGQRSFLNKKTYASYAKKLNRYEKNVGRNAQTLAARATYFVSKADYAQAELFAQSALAEDREGVNSLRINGDVYYHKSHVEAFENLEDTDPRIFTLNGDMKKAVDYFEQALRKSPDDHESVTHLVALYGSSEIPVTNAAQAAASTFEALYWDSNDVNGGLNLANIHMKSGNTAQACDYFKTSKQQIDTDPDRDKFSMSNRVKSMMAVFGSKCGIS